jgi:site-specific recombinase XerD
MNYQLQNIINNLSFEELQVIKTLVNEIEKQRTSSFGNSVNVERFSSEYLKYIENNFSSSYLRSATLSFTHLSRFFGKQKPLNELSVKNAEDFKTYLMQTAPLGYKVYLRNLKAAFNKAADWEMVTANPFAKVKINQVQQVAPTFICRKELYAIVELTSSPILRELFLFGFYTGCRLGEIVNLQWKHINLSKKCITIGDVDLHTKNKRTRAIPICKILYNELDQLQYTDDGDQYVFSKSNGFPFNRDYVSRAFKKVVRKASLSEKIHFHTLRHSFASHLALEGVPLIVIKELLGHSSIVTTQIYSHSDLDSLQKAVRKFDEPIQAV